DVYSNVIAGVAMDDGQTIVAWLPEADVEFGLSFSFSFPPTPDVTQVPAAPGVPSVPAVPPAMSPFANSWEGFKGGFFEPPDVTVIGADGKTLLAKYVGLDAVTGLSILKLASKSSATVGAFKEEPVDVGETVRLFGPEPVSGQRGLLN